VRNDSRRGAGGGQRPRIYARAAQPARQVPSIPRHGLEPGSESNRSHRSRARKRVGCSLWIGRFRGKSMSDRLAEIASALRQAELDGWLFYDFRLSDPIAYRVLGLSEAGTTTRRWFLYVPAAGRPRALVSAVEAHRLDALEADRIVYRSYAELAAGVASLLAGTRRIAMNYSPRG